MFLLSYLTYWNLTSNTEILGYDTYIQFFSIWRSLKPLFLVMVLIKVYYLSEYSKKQLVLISVYLLATYWICKNYHPNYYLLYAVSFCFSAKGIKYKIIAKAYLLYSVCTLLITFVALWYGIINDNIVMRGIYQRHSFGLVHPNSFGMWSLMIIIFYIQYKYDSIKPFHFIALLAQALAVYCYTNSRASFALSIMSISLSFLVTCIRENQNKYKYLMKVLAIAILSIVIIWFIICYRYGFHSSLSLLIDKMCSGRVHWSNQAINDYPPTLFGNNVTFSYPVDPLFTYTLVIYGYVGLAMFLSMFYVGALRTYRKRLPFILIAFLSFQMYNTQENVFLYHLFDLTMFTATCDLD